ncbi:MAG TPA: hypothetical protein PLS56_02125 [Candidatus Dojkabacteria bacterium]|jgi:glutathione synthase/RimK-type ligase-like ATP-grasp enzyme|nr:hypothetical protein [Candidatus Dojkabacteria bacterium]
MKFLIIEKRQRIHNNKSPEEIPTGSARLLEELEKKNIKYDFIYNDQLEFIFKPYSMNILANGKDILEYSHILFRGHALHNDREYHFKRYIIDYVDKYNEKNPNNKILVQNADAIKKLPYYNKIAMAQLCWENDLPYFTTYYRADGNYISAQRSLLNEYPLIIKEYSGVNKIVLIDGKEKVKKNVFKLNSPDDYSQEGLKGQDLTSFFIQEFSNAGEDYRIFMKLGKVIAGWKRKSTNSFITVNKGEYEIYNKPNEEIKKIAEKMCSVLNADFLAVDFMYIGQTPYIQEISLNPGYKAYETKAQGTPINIAEQIISAFKVPPF